MLTEKGLNTRSKIIEKSAELFNIKGYAGTSISDILTATNYSKGALYRTFPDKKNLGVEAFKFNLKNLQRAFRSFLNTKEDVKNTKEDVKQKLFSIPDFYIKNRVDDLVVGGCPILNTSTESDDIDKTLNSLVKDAFNDWKVTIEKLVDDGKEQGIFSLETDSKAVAFFMIAAIEGSILLSKAYKNHDITKHNMKALKEYIKLSLEEN